VTQQQAGVVLLPSDQESVARMAGRMRDEVLEDRISDSCGTVGGAGHCLRRERRGSDLCESASTLRTSHPKSKPKQVIQPLLYLQAFSNVLLPTGSRGS